MRNNKDYVDYENCLAFISCIAGLEIEGDILYPTSERILGAYGLINSNLAEKSRHERKRDRYKGGKTKRIYKITDIETGEIQVLNHVEEIENLTGLRSTLFTTYASRKCTYKGKYRFEFYEGDNNNGRS